MRKSTRKFCFKLKVINDGATFYHKEHFWRGWTPLPNKDISSNPVWNGKDGSFSKLENQKSYFIDYTKKFVKTP